MISLSFKFHQLVQLISIDGVSIGFPGIFNAVSMFCVILMTGVVVNKQIKFQSITINAQNLLRAPSFAMFYSTPTRSSIRLEGILLQSSQLQRSN